MYKLSFLLIISVLVSCGTDEHGDISSNNSTNDSLIVAIDSFALVDAKVNQHPNSTSHLIERAKFYLLMLRRLIWSEY